MGYNLKQLPIYEDINPNTKTIETNGGLGIISEGQYKGLQFIKTKKGFKMLGYNEEFLKEMIEKINNGVQGK